ncbi:RAD50-interacting protein 1 [Blyttiomyces sp. JEL0837]|nr:RAD50-interacting protein 1 [Blyttiomyces sp. JEL0837]
MCSMIKYRLQYHFGGEKLTNRLDKPEWLLDHILQIVHENQPFFEDIAQPVLRDCGQGWRDAKVGLLALYSGDSKTNKMKEEFVRGVTEYARNKLYSDAMKLKSSPDLLVHLVSEVMEFDASIRRTVFAADEDSSDLLVLTAPLMLIFLDSDDLFHAWISAEKKAADLRIDSMLADDPWSFVNSTDTKVTRSAEAFIAIVDNISVRYRHLPILSKVAFFERIQLPLFERYLVEVRQTVIVQESRFVPITGADNSVDSKSLRLGLLCRLVSSLAAVNEAIADFGEQTLYLDIWEEIKKTVHTDDNETTLFSEVVDAFKNLETRIETLVIEECCKEFVEAAWAYDKKRDWNESSVDSENEVVTPELMLAIAPLRQYLLTFKLNLSRRSFNHALREISQRLALHLWNRILLRWQFSQTGARQLLIDINKGLWGGCFATFMPLMPADMQKLAQGALLMTLNAQTVLDIVESLEQDGQHSALHELGLSRLSQSDVILLLNK